MVATTATIARQELRTTDGEVYAVIIPAEELERLRGEVTALQDQLARAQHQRDRNLAKLEHVLRTYIPIPPTAVELAAPHATSADVQQLLAELESS